MKIWIRYVIAVMVFIFAVFGFSLYFNQGTTDMTVEMQTASLPVVYVDIEGSYVNEMHGYMDRMDVGTLYKSLTPIGKDRKIRFVVEKYGQSISGLSVEVRTMDGQRLIEDTKVVNYRDLKNELETTVALKDLIESETEYSLTLVLNLSDGRTVYYYTRVIQNENAEAKEKLDFVMDFNEKTFSYDRVKEELYTYLEPSTEGDNSDFGSADIHCSYSHISWGKMEPLTSSVRNATIHDIGDKMASIELKYQVSTRVDGDIRHYNVQEFYRVRKSSDRFHLITFDRKMDEIFVMDKDSFTDNKIHLGILNRLPGITQSEGGDVIAFVNGGRIYSYNLAENKLIRLFAFYDDSEDDLRHQYQDSDIRILSVEENGNVSFIVYGYMNRGIHEGYVGASLCYYDSLVNTIEEQVFIPYNKAESILKCDVEQLCYYNLLGDLFLYMDGTIYKVSTNDMEYTKIASSLNTDTFFVSGEHNYIAWQERSGINKLTDSLCLMNLDTENITLVQTKEEAYLIPIGFMNDDLIYGTCNTSDVISNTFGDTISPMHKVVIQDENGKIVKEYERNDVYVVGGKVDENQITLYRATKNPENGKYTEIDNDHITSNEDIREEKNTIRIFSTETYKREYEILLKNEVDLKSMKLLTPKSVIFEGGKDLSVETAEDDRFMVYGNGESLGIYDDPAEAVDVAYDVRGKVVDMSGNVIYQRGEIAERNQIMAIKEDTVTDNKNSLAVCLDNMLKLQGVSRNTEYNLGRGESVYSILNDNMRGAYILNLTGCDMGTVTYYVNRDIPVLALLNNGDAVLIVGFNAQNLVLFDPVKGEIYKKGMNDSREMFENNGNRFITYATKSAI